MKLPPITKSPVPPYDPLAKQFASEELRLILEKDRLQRVGRLPAFSRPLVPLEERENIGALTGRQRLLDAMMQSDKQIGKD
jgi:hypothetical protein